MRIRLYATNERKCIIRVSAVCCKSDAAILVDTSTVPLVTSNVRYIYT